MTTAERQPISQNAGLLNKKQLGRRLISFDQYAILVARLYGPVGGDWGSGRQDSGGSDLQKVCLRREKDEKGLPAMSQKKLAYTGRRELLSVHAGC